MRLRAFYALLAIAVLVFDQAAKRWAVAALQGRPDLDLVDGLARLSYAENPGIAFSLFNSGAPATRWLLALVSTTAVAIVATFIARTSPRAVRLQVTLALLLGGIAGNLVDRVALGRVVDFIEVYDGSFHWPTFNVADSAITVGAFLLAVELLKGESREAEQARPPA